MEVTKSRVECIDILRGIVMVIMALDHVRDYFHIADTGDPLNLATTTPILFFTRWITHYCAPVFIFLSGTSVYLQSQRKTKSELCSFLLKRGLWLIALEAIVVTFGWTFNPAYNVIILQVIWAIGISMVLLSFIIRLPYKMILTLGLLIVLGHNLLDIPESAPGFHASFLWNLLHHGRFVHYSITENHALLIIYPFFPWTGLMTIGYCLGKLFTKDVSAAERTQKLSLTGIGLILLFIVLRFTNAYGDPVAWTQQLSGFYTFLSFINVYKYPPSLLFMCITVGPALLALACLENIQNKATNIFRIYGRVALFYYVIHIYFIHLLLAVIFFMRGHTMNDAYNPASHFPFYFKVPGEGFSLPIVYLIWIAVVVALYPLCKWYDSYKSSHKEKKWLSYL